MDDSPFREPQLVEVAQITANSALSVDKGDLNSWAKAGGADWGPSGDGQPTTSAYAWDPSPSTWEPNATWSQQYDVGGHGVSTSKLVDIDGRDVQEEENWWDVAVREKWKRPGPGALPPYLAEMLHHPDHSLYSVSVTQPIIPLDATSRDASDIGPAFEPPSIDDLIHAVPHPHAYFCRKHNGWVLLQWKSSSMLPPLAKSFVLDTNTSFPDLARRKRTGSCVGDTEQSFTPTNKTHHFHRYERAVNAHKLDPAFRRAGWEKANEKKEARRKITSFNLDEISIDQMPEVDVHENEEEEGDLLDLYVCCQCSVYCIASCVIPGVIPIKYLEDYIRDRSENPPPTKSREESVMLGLETFLRYSASFSFTRSTLKLDVSASSRRSCGKGKIGHCL